MVRLDKEITLETVKRYIVYANIDYPEANLGEELLEQAYKRVEEGKLEKGSYSQK